jgi:hypothetical protein
MAAYLQDSSTLSRTPTETGENVHRSKALAYWIFPNTEHIWVRDAGGVCTQHEAGLRVGCYHPRYNTSVGEFSLSNSPCSPESPHSPSCPIVSPHGLRNRTFWFSSPAHIIMAIVAPAQITAAPDSNLVNRLLAVRQDQIPTCGWMNADPCKTTCI